MIDLHIHSSFSDGTLKPEEIFKKAKKLKLEAISITDHDNARGIREANVQNEKIKFVPGIEISVEYNKNIRLHILGLFIDVFSKEIISLEEEQIFLREERNLKMVKKLKKLGYKIEYFEVKEIAKMAVGKLHFANLLVKKGYFKNVEEAMKKLLRKGCPAFVEKKRIPLIEGVEKIKKAKGIPVVSHILKEFNSLNEVGEVLKDLRKKGIEGVEVYHSDHKIEDMKILEEMAKKNSFVISGGSDFHGKNKKYTKMGTGKGNLNIPFEVYENLKNYWEKNFK